MRFATYNVHDCIGRDRRYDPQRIAAVLSELDADLVALQEVTLDSAGELIEMFQSVTALRAYDGSLIERGIGRYGNLILTSATALRTRLHDLSFPDREPRGCIEAEFAIEGQHLSLFATHLGLRNQERRAQLARLAELAADSHSACVLLGDLNLWGYGGALRPLRALGFVEQSVRSFPTRGVPLAALDRILVRSPVTLRRCWRHDTPLSRVASDHFPVLAELHLDP